MGFLDWMEKAGDAAAKLAPQEDKVREYMDELRQYGKIKPANKPDNASETASLNEAKKRLKKMEKKGKKGGGFVVGGWGE